MANDVQSLAHTKWNCKYHIVFGPCQVVTEFLSGDRLKQGLHRTDRLTKQVNTVNLAKGITFVFKKTPVMFDFKQFI